MRRLAFAVLLCAVLAFGQSGIRRPSAGMFRDRAGDLRPVFGVPGAFVLGDPVAERVESASFSSNIGAVKTEDRLQIRDGSGKILQEWELPRGTARVAVSPDGMRVAAFIFETGELRYWSSETPDELTVAWVANGTEVLSLAMPDSGRVTLLVRSDNGIVPVDYSLTTGQFDLKAPLAGTADPILLRADGTLLFAEANELAVRPENEDERRIALACGVKFLAEMGSEWIHVAADCGEFALRLSEDREELYRLPEAQQ